MTPEAPVTRTSDNQAWVRPRVVLSRCLEHAACRYDGQVIRDDFVARLGRHVEFITVCPEVQIGLGVPRPVIRLEGDGKEPPRLVQPSTGQDLTRAMSEFSRETVAGLADVDGYILKSRSPSCGLRDVKVRAPGGEGPAVGKTAGLFAAEALRHNGDLAMEDEGRLRNYRVREHFLTKLFVLAELRQLRSTKPTMRALTDFQARHKLLLMSYNQVGMRRLGRIAANPDQRPIAELRETYSTELRAALARIARRRSQINVAQHAMGYFKTRLGAEEKRYFLDALERFRLSRLPLSSLLAILRSWIARFDEPYLAGQSYFEPYPEQLVVMQDSGKGRDF